jgi:hypothetical protein
MEELLKLIQSKQNEMHPHLISVEIFPNNMGYLLNVNRVINAGGNSYSRYFKTYEGLIKYLKG